jgi:hypothetical protein
MSQHAVQTALTLYRNGTLNLETAARQAGVSPSKFRQTVDRLGVSVPTPTTESERIAVRAD